MFTITKQELNVMQEIRISILINKTKKLSLIHTEGRKTINRFMRSKGRISYA
jgi:hypothetical protein